MPAYTIAQNAGVEGAVVVGKLLEQTNFNIGYDAAKGLSAFLSLLARRRGFYIIPMTMSSFIKISVTLLLDISVVSWLYIPKLI